MLVLITYDVNTTTSAGKKRLRTVANKCVAHGTRVQNSVFECVLDNSQYKLLKHELEQHKRVFEALGSKLAVADADDQLSGLGFSATKRNDVVVKVKGTTERVFKVKF